ncbi:MAG TPA: tripartite tricarboxylate transporter substrate-binding protein [Xanthobacteraceae bacterium]|nr:tripartite tricarboxylate transporter substrate-binding protein [Xanthobacteraceae bacterium]
MPYRTGAAVLLGLLWLTAVVRAQPTEEFFRGKKELNLVTSSAAGGGYDSYSRLLARYMSRYLPGNPTIVVQNMLGGGGIRAANYIYNVAPRDGTVFALIDRGIPTAPLLYGDKSQGRFDAVRFSWIGSVMRETGMGVMSTQSAVGSIEEARSHPMFFGATGPETDPAMYARLTNELLGTKIRVINGYKGQPEEFQAMEKGELDGLFMSGWSGPGRTYVRDQIGKGKMRLLVQMAPARDPQHPETPTIMDLVSAPLDRQIVALVMDRVSLGRPVVAPPELAPDRLELMRAAFRQAIEDPELRADAERQRLAIDPVYGAEAQVIIGRLYGSPAEVVERLRRIVQFTEP